MRTLKSPNGRISEKIGVKKSCQCFLYDILNAKFVFVYLFIYHQKFTSSVSEQIFFTFRGLQSLNSSLIVGFFSVRKKEPQCKQTFGVQIKQLQYFLPKYRQKNIFFVSLNFVYAFLVLENLHFSLRKSQNFFFRPTSQTPYTSFKFLTKPFFLFHYSFCF